MSWGKKTGKVGVCPSVCLYVLSLGAREGCRAELAWVANDDDVDELQETLIVWSEGDNCDYALSFQEKKGCDEVWEKICQVVFTAVYILTLYYVHM